MSRQLINRSPDLIRLQNEGYEVEVLAGHLLILSVPYVNANRQIKRGILISKLELAGDSTTPPKDHVAMFAGEHPCDKHGKKLEKIAHQTQNQTIANGTIVNHSFSSKPVGGGKYRDYFHKMQTYTEQISSHALAIDPSATAKTRKVILSDEGDSPFNYIDTASSRAKKRQLQKN